MKKIGCYLMKLHTASQYENCAFIVKSYSYALYNLLNNHAKEDRKQAEMIYQDAVNSKEHEGMKAFDNVLLPLIYIDESKDDMEAISIDILEAFIWIEKQVYQQFIAHESFGYADISKFRIDVLEEALNCIEKKTIFSSHHHKQWWKCSTCGAIYVEDEAYSSVSEECHICGSSQGAFVKHFQIGA